MAGAYAKGHTGGMHKAPTKTTHKQTNGFYAWHVRGIERALPSAGIHAPLHCTSQPLLFAFLFLPAVLSAQALAQQVCNLRCSLLS